MTGLATELSFVPAEVSDSNDGLAFGQQLPAKVVLTSSWAMVHQFRLHHLIRSRPGTP